MPASLDEVQYQQALRSSIAGGLAPLPHDAPTFALGGTTPDALTLAVSQGVLEASLTDRAFGANSLGFGRIGLVL